MMVFLVLNWHLESNNLLTTINHNIISTMKLANFQEKSTDMEKLASNSQDKSLLLPKVPDQLFKVTSLPLMVPKVVLHRILSL